MVILRLAKYVAMALARHDLTENQYRTLGFIADGDADFTEMSVRLVMKKPNLTTLIDGLVVRGLVERTRRADDRRRLDLVLTDAGRVLFAAASSDAEESLAMLAGLDEGEPTERLDAIASWASTVEVAAEILRSKPPIAR